MTDNELQPLPERQPQEPAPGTTLGTVDRLIDRSTIHWDVAACIRWTFIGVALILLVLTNGAAGLSALRLLAKMP
jgi:hypothetical protein